jgi:phosphoribosylaminoimidazole-succinocarboxamide synthase
MTQTVMNINVPGITKFKSGKVREVFDAGDYLLFVATDRISAFDVILPTAIPCKGYVLNQLSAWWFDRTRDIVRNHLVSTDPEDFPEAFKPHVEILRGRSMLVKKAKLLPIECVVRGYLIGSGWKDYQRTGQVCGIPLRSGYRLADKLDEPIFTPAHKAETGHDENITFDDVVKLVGATRAEELKRISIQLYTFAARYALSRGIIIADTKFEFGILNGQLILVDEALTPDSSRFWPAASYKPGESPLSFDKQYVRDYLETLDWDKTPPGPPLPDAIVQKTSEKYREAFRLLTGREVEA